MTGTYRFVFRNSEDLHVPFANDADTKYYLAVIVVNQADKDKFTDVISTTVIGLLPSYLKRLRWQGIQQIHLENVPVLKAIVRQHFEDDFQRIRNLLMNLNTGTPDGVRSEPSVAALDGECSATAAPDGASEIQ